METGLDRTNRNAGVIAGSVVGSLIAVAFVLVLCVTVSHRLRPTSGADLDRQHRRTRRDSIAERAKTPSDDVNDEKRRSGWVPHSQSFAHSAELYGEEAKSPYPSTPLPPATPSLLTKAEEAAISDESSVASVEEAEIAEDDRSEVVSVDTDDKDDDAKLHHFIPRYDSDNESGTVRHAGNPQRNR
jgi:hypothetical protein